MADKSGTRERKQVYKIIYGLYKHSNWTMEKLRVIMIREQESVKSNQHYTRSVLYALTKILKNVYFEIITNVIVVTNEI